MFEPTKICNKCGTSKYEGDFMVSQKRNGQLSVSGFCRNCYNNLKKGYYARDRDRYAGHGRRWRNSARYMTLIVAARGRAKKAGLAFDLDDHRDALRAKAESGCELTGIPFVEEDRGKPQWNSASFDRIRPELGYIFSNVRVICWGLNAAFGTWGEDQTAMLMQAWLDKRN